MARCFCGCGRKIGFGVRRGMNKNIRRTDDLVAKLKTGREAFAAVVVASDGESLEEFDPTELLDRLDGLINDGEDHREFWVEATHGHYPREPSTALEVKREWNAWTRSALSMWVLIERRRRIDNW